MNTLEVTKLLLLINGFDPRIQTNETRVAAWQVLFTDACPDMPYKFAEKMAVKHYAKSGDPLLPNVIVASWKDAQRQQLDQVLSTAEPLERTEMPDWFKNKMKSVGVIPYE